jgi:hypothetical protein
MITLLQVTQGPDQLVLSYPLWIGLTLLAIAGALLGRMLYARARIRRSWALAVAILLAGWSGLYFYTFKATLSDEAGSVYAFMRYDHAVRWADAVDIYLEHRGGGRDWHIVVIDRERRAHDFNVADLSVEDRDRIMGYMVDRMPAGAFARAPALLKRHADRGLRRVDLLGDQQI